MTFDEYIESCARSAGTNLDWRWGQCLFNKLFDLNPELADRIRGTDMDPFYNDDPFIMMKFCNFVKDNWDK